MQPLSTSILAEPLTPVTPMSLSEGQSLKARPLTLSDALRENLAGSLAPTLESGGDSEPGIRECPIGRIKMLKAIGGPLSINTQGCSADARVTVLVQLGGSSLARQGKREAEIGAGDLFLMRNVRPLEIRFEEPFQIALVEAPENEIADSFPLWPAAMLTPIRGSSGVPAVFCDAVRSVHRWRDSLTGAASERLADALINLMGALVCFAVPLNSDCLQKSLYQKDRIKNVAQLHLHNPELNVDFIAESAGLSVRQVHRLFADEGISLMRWVWVRRLEQCHRELSQNESGKRPISDIAYRWGFNDQAHFSRSFRKHFGISPRDLRRQSNDGILGAEPARSSLEQFV